MRACTSACEACGCSAAADAAADAAAAEAEAEAKAAEVSGLSREGVAAAAVEAVVVVRRADGWRVGVAVSRGGDRDGMRFARFTPEVEAADGALGAEGAEEEVVEAAESSGAEEVAEKAEDGEALRGDGERARLVPCDFKSLLLRRD